VRPDDIGSEFHWDPAVLTGGGPSWLPARRSLFATGCGALGALLRMLAPRGRLHVPSYFCTGVAESLSALVPIAWYRHLPDGRGPRFATLRAGDGDVVLAQNLFGRDDGGPWDDWMRAHPSVTVVEDHSHDPFGVWARVSTAPYAVASLRKTLPVPDGGLLWSPRDLDLPRPSAGDSAGAQLKLAAMMLKSAWIDGWPVAKDAFRELQSRGERELLVSEGPISAFSAAILPLLDVAAIRQRSVDNARALRAALPPSAGGWSLLPPSPQPAPTQPAPARSAPARSAPGLSAPGFSAPGLSAPAEASSGLVRGGRMVGGAPFRVQLLCPSPDLRDALLSHLARHRIYAPVHWRQDRAGFWSGDEEAAALADRMLTVPVDHRCTPADVRRVARALLEFAEISVS
jgi:hypothetical protein